MFSRKKVTDQISVNFIAPLFKCVYFTTPCFHFHIIRGYIRCIIHNFFDFFQCIPDQFCDFFKIFGRLIQRTYGQPGNHFIHSVYNAVCFKKKNLCKINFRRVFINFIDSFKQRGHRVTQLLFAVGNNCSPLFCIHFAAVHFFKSSACLIQFPAKKRQVIEKFFFFTVHDKLLRFYLFAFIYIILSHRQA